MCSIAYVVYVKDTSDKIYVMDAFCWHVLTRTQRIMNLTP